MTRLQRTTKMLGSLAILALFATAAIAEEVGRIAAVEPAAEIGRDGAFTAATVGAAVNQGDTLRTGKPGKLRVVFRDDSVLNLGPGSELVVTEQVFDPNESRYRSVINLIKGKVRAIVSDYYKQPRASYEIKTGTAVAGVRGTEFVMTFDEEAEVTEVVGVADTVSVAGTRDPRRGVVLVKARDLTTVRKGQLPTRPRQLEEAEFQQYLQGVQFIGAGAAESLSVQHPVLQGAAVPAVDTADAVIGRAAAADTSAGTFGAAPPVESGGSANPDASGLIGQPAPVVETIQGGRGEVGIEF